MVRSAESYLVPAARGHATDLVCILDAFAIVYAINTSGALCHHTIGVTIACFEAGIVPTGAVVVDTAGIPGIHVFVASLRPFRISTNRHIAEITDTLSQHNAGSRQRQQ
jgi:hypothetical protein